MRPFLRLASSSSSSLRRSIPRSVSTFARSSAHQARSSTSRVGVGIGAVALTGYIGWHLSSTQNRVYADTTAAAPAKTLDHESPSKTKVEKVETHTPPPSEEPSQTKVEGDHPPSSDDQHPREGVAEGLEEPAAPTEGEEDPSKAAFNPVTGEINWDCPCLGGMAHGPCGPEFREAFSCFVYSEGEPKGIECVEKFKGMQDCFRQHPEIYAEEIDDDDEATLDAADPAAVPAHMSEDQAPLSSTHDEFVADPAPIPDPAPAPVPTPPSSLPIKFEPVTFEAPESAPPPKKPALGKARAISSSG